MQVDAATVNAHGGFLENRNGYCATSVANEIENEGPVYDMLGSIISDS